MATTDFHSNDIDSVNNVRVDLDDEYFVFEVTFDNAEDGEVYYPYRVVTRDSGMVCDTGPQGAYARVPVDDGEGGNTGYREQSVSPSDIPDWVVNEATGSASVEEEICADYGLREVEFRM